MRSAPRPSRRAATVSTTLAVAVHVVILVFVARARVESQNATPPGISGLGLVEEVVGGLPASTVRFTHTFRILNEETAQPVAGARVTDVLGNSQTLTSANGVARLQVRAAARLIVHVEKAGFAMFVSQFENIRDNTQPRTVILRRQLVPYTVLDTLFIQRCNYCHGAVGTTQGVNLTTFERVIASTARGGPIIVPDKPDSSRLYRVLVDSMDANGKPSAHFRVTQATSAYDLEWIAQWILEGAKGPVLRK
ncbi:MAG: hypothetical protein P3A28_02315 [Gemmatimonadota bacterium]|nr:hypothetical protein [Gemmatimonadota bacterium]